MGTARGRDAFEVVKETVGLTDWSIGYRNVKTAELSAEWRAKGARWVIRSLDLIEVSPVFEGANQMTGTLTLKRSATPDPDVVREFERFKANTARYQVEVDPWEQRAELRKRLGDYNRKHGATFAPSVLDTVRVHPELDTETAQVVAWVANRWGVKAPAVRWFREPAGRGRMVLRVPA